MKSALFIVALLLAACAPDASDGLVWVTADEETRTHLPFEDIATVRLGQMTVHPFTYFEVELHASGDAHKHDDRGMDGGRKGRSVSELSADQWARVGDALSDVELFAAPVDEEPSYGFAGLAVTTTDHAYFDLEVSLPEAREAICVIEEIEAELAWKIPSSLMRPVDEEIVSLEFVERGGRYSSSNYVVQLERNGEMRKTDEREKGDHERGRFRGDASSDDVDALFSFIANSDAFAMTGSFGRGRETRQVQIKYTSGRTISVSSRTVMALPEVFAAIQAIKAIDDETEWTPR